MSVTVFPSKCFSNFNQILSKSAKENVNESLLNVLFLGFYFILFLVFNLAFHILCFSLFYKISTCTF